MFKVLFYEYKIILTEFVYFFIYQFDNAQQRSYAIVQDAYAKMENGDYKIAEEEFTQYLNIHSSEIYWKIHAFVNRNDESSYANVQKALEKCQKRLDKT